MEEPDRFSPEELRDVLTPSLNGGAVHYFPTIDSTNDLAKKLAAAGAAEWTVVISDEQTRGRGRMGRRWESPAGAGILMSLILRPPLSPAASGRIALLSAVAVAEAVEKVTGLSAGIKWPNDIMVNNRKVAGILTEMTADLDRSPAIVVGIGINVNNRAFPDKIGDTATSLRICLGRPVSRRKVLLSLVEELRRWYGGFSRHGQLGKTLESYRERSVSLGKRVRVTYQNREFTAGAVDITEQGGLLVQPADGAMIEIVSGEASLREEGGSDIFGGRNGLKDAPVPD